MACIKTSDLKGKNSITAKQISIEIEWNHDFWYLCINQVLNKYRINNVPYPDYLRAFWNDEILILVWQVQ